MCFDCKDTNSNRRTLKSARKRLNFNYFKERLVHFNGTVVIKNKKKETYLPLVYKYVSCQYNVVLLCVGKDASVFQFDFQFGVFAVEIVSQAIEITATLPYAHGQVVE